MTSAALLDLTSVPLDTQTVPQQRLDIENKTRANPLPWRGQFSPQLVHALLETYCSGGAQTVLDPFAGSGTVLLEAARLGFPAVAAEINPAPFLLSRIYEFCNSSAADRHAAVAEADKAIAEALRPRFGLFATDEPDDGRVLEPLLTARATFHGQGAVSLLDAAIVLSDAGAAAFTQERFLATWDQLKRLVSQLPFSSQPVRTNLADARSLPLRDSEVSLVVTSPPYINVFNYHQQYRTAVELLGWDILAAAQSEIGSNRKNRSNRFLTIVQYAIDMAHVLQELCRVALPGARLIFIVGRESTVRGMTVRNGQLLLSVAAQAARLRVMARQERKFLNRYGQVIFEDILHFEAVKHSADPVAAANLALALLQQLRPQATSPEIRDDIEQAILDLPAVRSSRLLQPAQAQTRANPAAPKS
jgi:hypothetical protein